MGGRVLLYNFANIRKRENIFVRIHTLPGEEAKVYDQRVETFIQCHINAFKYFEGITEYVKTDNLKAAILLRNWLDNTYNQRVHGTPPKGFQEMYLRR